MATINDQQEKALALELRRDEESRNRKLYDYTLDDLLHGAIIPYAIWPEANASIAGVISGLVDYDSLPIDEGNENSKGMIWQEQRMTILLHGKSEPLCEALNMTPCLKEQCQLYDLESNPPICREYKMAFRK